jgi:hypothetical protein
MRARGTITLVLLLALGVCAPAASAEPLSMTFTEARANVGIQLSDAALLEAPDTAPFAAQIDPGSGAITAGVLEVPQFFTHITEPIKADVTVDFEIGEISGTFTQATGALTLEGEAGGTLTAQSGTYAGEACFVSTTPEVLALSTAGKAEEDGSPRAGEPFNVGLAGAGAIAGRWTDMDAEPVEPANNENISFCNNVEDRIGGPGGIWMKQKGVVPPTPQPPITNPPPPVLLPPAPTCVVPKLNGKTLKAAKRKIRAASCQLGTIRKPKRVRGQGAQVLVVKSASPAAGSSPANGKVHLKLGLKS